jgi:hypothetical protein
MESLSFEQTANAIIHLGKTNSILVEGDIGIGKSSLRHAVLKAYPGHTLAYIDAANIDLGDLTLPVPDIEAKCVRWLANEVFKLHIGGPLVVMIDELGKAPRPVQNALLPLILEHRVGSTILHEDSLVFATTNLSTNGVGDSIQAHALNRMTVVRMGKPSAHEWIENFASVNGIAGEIIAFVKEFPQVFAEYDPSKGAVDSAYIHNPTKPQRAFVTHRSMEKASDIVKRRELVGSAVTMATLEGTIGTQAAMDLRAFIALGDKLPKTSSIIENPDDVAVPGNAGLALMLLYNLLSVTDATTVGNIAKFVDKMNDEMRSIYYTCLVRKPTTQHLITDSKSPFYRHGLDAVMELNKYIRKNTGV